MRCSCTGSARDAGHHFPKLLKTGFSSSEQCKPVVKESLSFTTYFLSKIEEIAQPKRMDEVSASKSPGSNPISNENFLNYNCIIPFTCHEIAGDLDWVPEGVLRVERGVAKILKGRLCVSEEAHLVGFGGERMNQTGLELDNLAHDRVEDCLAVLKRTLMNNNANYGR